MTPRRKNELLRLRLAEPADDVNGNTLSDAQGRGFTWDFENRLTQVVVPGTGTVAFKNDPFRRRIQKSGSLGTTNYLYDGMSSRANVVEEVDNAGNMLARYTQSRNVDELLSELRSGTTSYYEEDGLGSITSLSTGTGVLANIYTYDSFGKLTASSGSLINPFQYTGRESDSETNLYYYRARYYDQSSGRFLREDPLKGVSGSVNFYSYVNNNPINLFDPSGLCPCDTVTRTLRLVPHSDCSHHGYREIYYELVGPGASNWWVTEHQNPGWWAGSTGQSTQGSGAFDDTVYGWRIGKSLQSFTISLDDPRKVPNTAGCPVYVQLPSGPNGSPQDFQTLGMWHGGTGGYMYINGNPLGWVSCVPSFDER
jgi:RHS repeat-associated protein